MGRKMSKRPKIMLTTGRTFTREKCRGERSHSRCICQSCSGWRRSSCVLRKVAEYVLLKWKRKKRLKAKANNWIWLGLDVSVCSAMWLCLHSWSVCPGSSQRGAGFGTAGHSYSISALKNHWTPPSPRRSLFRNMRAQDVHWQNTSSALGRLFYFLPSQLLLLAGLLFYSAIMISKRIIFCLCFHPYCVWWETARTWRLQKTTLDNIYSSFVRTILYCHIYSLSFVSVSVSTGRKCHDGITVLMPSPKTDYSSSLNRTNLTG